MTKDTAKPGVQPPENEDEARQQGKLGPMQIVGSVLATPLLLWPLL